MSRGKKKKLADGEIIKFIHVYDDDITFDVAKTLNKDIYFVENLLYYLDLITVNHVRYLYWIKAIYEDYEEFKNLFNNVCFWLDETTAMIAPDGVDISIYDLDSGMPDEIQAQLKPVTREDVFDMAEKLRNVIAELYENFSNNICWWMDDEGVEDYNEYLGVKCFELLLDGAFYKYMDEFRRYEIPKEWDLLEYLLFMWQIEKKSNYQAIVDQHLKEVKAFNQLTKDYTDASFELEELIFEQFKWQVEDEVQQDKLIDKKVKAVLDFHRNQTFNFNK